FYIFGSLSRPVQLEVYRSKKAKKKKKKKSEVWLPNFGETTANLAKLRRTCIFGRFGEITPRRLCVAYMRAFHLRGQRALASGYTWGWCSWLLKAGSLSLRAFDFEISTRLPHTTQRQCPMYVRNQITEKWWPASVFFAFSCASFQVA
ncbi:unnamed protein product, partial [Ixodes pacificus]